MNRPKDRFFYRNLPFFPLNSASRLRSKHSKYSKIMLLLDLARSLRNIQNKVRAMSRTVQHILNWLVSFFDIRYI